jgi:glycyl-tRNA synthetase
MTTDSAKGENKMEKVVSLLKRRGFIFPSSEIYGGLQAAYDYGPLGVELKNNIKRAWWRRFVQNRLDMVGLDAAIIMHPKVWEASGHVQNFTDPLIDCKKCKKRFRADHLLPANSIKPGYDKEAPFFIGDYQCPDCGGELTEIRQFNLMFKTFMGPLEEAADKVYLRPETAGGIFVNFKNVLDTMRMRIPFGVGQIGKAFRNEITVENFIFRTREFEQMEVEYFVHPNEWEKYFADWLQLMKEWCKFLGVKDGNLYLKEIEGNDRAFYSKRTVDFEYQYPFGRKELYGLAYRTDYDLSQHQKFSGQNLEYTDPVSKEKYIPHIIEPSLGVDRSFLVVLLEAYTEVSGGRTTTTDSTKETEIILKLPYELAPIKIAVLPLSKKEPLLLEAQDIARSLSLSYTVQYDEAGSIGRRYRRQDEIGTPYCITIDFETVNDNAVTIRDRDTMQQTRIPIAELGDYFKTKFI